MYARCNTRLQRQPADAFSDITTRYGPARADYIESLSPLQLTELEADFNSGKIMVIIVNTL